jgi:hypothetical protein
MKARFLFPIFLCGALTLRVQAGPRRTAPQEVIPSVEDCEPALGGVHSDPLSFAQQAPDAFFAAVAVELAVGASEESVSQAMMLLPPDLSLWAETFLSSPTLRSRLAIILANTPQKNYSRRPKTVVQLTSRINAYLKDPFVVLPPLASVLEASAESRQYLVDLYFHTEGSDPLSVMNKQKRALFFDELSQRVQADQWPATRGGSFRTFIDQVFALNVEESRDVFAALAMSWVDTLLSKYPQFRKLPNAELLTVIAGQFNSERTQGSELRPFLIATLLSVLSDVKVISGAALKKFVVGSLQAQQAQADFEAQVRQGRKQVHLRKTRSSRSRAAAPAPVELDKNSAEEVSDPTPIVTYEVSLTKDAQKDVAVLQPQAFARYEKFVAMATLGSRQLQVALRKEPGSWNLRRLDFDRHWSSVVYTVRLNREVRLGFRIIDGTDRIEIVAANKSFSRWSEN